MTITIGSTGDSIYLRNTNSGDSHNEVDRFVFADGTVLTSADLRARLMASLGAVGADQMYGTGFGDVIDGGLGNDRIDGGQGNDTLTGGKGDDYLAGSFGDDTYIFNVGDGHDTISALADLADVDTLRFSDLNSADVTLSQDGADLLVLDNATGQQVAVTNQLGDGHDDFGIEQIAFADGTVWDRQVEVLPTARKIHTVRCRAG